MKMNKLIMLMVSGVLAFSLMTGCGGGSDSVDIVDGVDPVTQTINTSGGVIELSSGFKVTFPEGAVEDSTQVTVSETSAPAALPSGIQAISPVYAISSSAGQLNLPAELQFPGGGSSPSGTVAVYRWDDVEKQWKFAGGIYSDDDDAVKTQVDGFSVYIIGAGGLVYKPVQFFQSGSFNMVAHVSEYEFDNPLQITRLASQAATTVWKATAPGDDLSPDQMTLPQGKYSFCADWWDDGSFGNTAGWYHRFVGDLPEVPAIWLGVNSNELDPPFVILGSNIDPIIELGRCGPARIVIPADAAEEFDFVGTYNVISLNPERPYEEYHATFIFEPDHSLTFDEWINDFEQSGAGDWQFDPSTDIFSFSSDAGASFSGVVSGTTDSFELNGKWAGGLEGSVQFTRP